MRRRPLALVLTAALIGAVFTALPAKAATEVPATVQIEDPVGDANTQTGDQQMGQDLSSVGDLMSVWFSNTPDTVSLHIQTEAPNPGAASNVRFNVYTNPTADLTGTSSCLRFEVIPSATPGAYVGSSLAKVVDRCTEEPGNFYSAEKGAVGELTLEELADGTGLMTATFPRDYGTVFADGAKITQPFAIDYMGGGSDAPSLPETPATYAGPFGFTGLRLDDTKVGTDFTIGGAVAEPPVVEEPKEPKPAKNPCKKLKGKKKKKCLKKNAAKPCTAYQPGEAGAEAETAIVTDAANADAPVEVTVTAEPGLGVGGNAQTETGITHVYHNVQVDPAAAETGLYVRLEMPAEEDYDLFLLREDGSQAAHAAGFNPEPAVFNDTEGGGHTENGAEVLEGIKTNDCGGYTIDVATASGFGGDLTVKLWLGEVKYEPEAPAAKAYVF